ncbi:hypothetical protein ADICYQ_1817 [Cyclobacterium qasimii M12-11B]|uniref:Uncharacterized protein n=1 Tax=Cyclobacterium qasimii M12-11B TaxID=641524 RepID=S7WR22_9BACT|nr:hypothetical protein ADICYQ_1817 [Cyclobacterium qasimii M12-11B]
MSEGEILLEKFPATVYVSGVWVKSDELSISHGANSFIHNFKFSVNRQ